MRHVDYGVHWRNEELLVFCLVVLVKVKIYKGRKRCVPILSLFTHAGCVPL